MGFYDDFDSVVLSPSHSASQGGAVALIVHDEEYPERPDAAEQVAQFFANPANQASTTGVIDNNSKVGCVPYDQAAWHTGAGQPWNSRCEGYEHSGYARQTWQEWLDPYGIDMLELSAAHYANRCKALGIPPRRIDPQQLRHAVLVTGNPADGGICGHYDITVAAGIYGGHTDPGPQFPWDYYISRVQAHYNGVGPTPPTPEVDPLAPYTPDQLRAATRGDFIARDARDGGSIWWCSLDSQSRRHLPTPDFVDKVHTYYGVPFLGNAQGAPDLDGALLDSLSIVINDVVVPESISTGNLKLIANAVADELSRRL